MVPWYGHQFDQLIGLRFTRIIGFLVPQGVVLDDTFSLHLLSLIELFIFLLVFRVIIIIVICFSFVNIFIFVTIVD